MLGRHARMPSRGDIHRALRTWAILKRHKLKDPVWLLGGADGYRRLLGSLIPQPDGTSYNAHLVCGAGKTAPLDTVEPSKAETPRIPHANQIRMRG